MYVIKRNGEKQEVSLDKVTKRIKNLSYELSVDPIEVSKFVASSIRDGIETREIDDVSATVANDLAIKHPHYSMLAGRILASNLKKQTKGFMGVIEFFKNSSYNLFSKDYTIFCHSHKEKILREINYKQDLSYDFFAMQTLKRSYLLRDKNGNILERPQDMLMRSAVQVGMNEGIDFVLHLYRMLSEKKFTFATPTLYNSGFQRNQLASCYVLDMQDDSIYGIFATLSDTAEISKGAGGVGISVSKIRSRGSFIHGTDGISAGLQPMAKVFDETAKYVDQGGGKRRGSFAMYLEPWHADIMDFLDLRRVEGSDDTKVKNIFTALWVPDLFMKRLLNGEDWSLFDPNVIKEYIKKHDPHGTCKNGLKPLQDVYGDEFEALYNLYEKEGLATKKITAQSLFYFIISTQMLTGLPYICFKDHVNRKSNQKNVGIIHSSNLCAEIMEHTRKDRTAVCTLASISLPAFYDKKRKEFDYCKFGETVRTIVRALDLMIDNMNYPTLRARISNSETRPLGIGVQGLADLLFLMDIPFDSDEARKTNKVLFEHLYYHAVLESIALAAEKGTYQYYQNSPASRELLQFDLCGIKEEDLFLAKEWKILKKDLHKYGLRNSLLIALMPTASTSQILGNFESFRPPTTNLWTRSTLAGYFTLLNPYLVDDLCKLGLWDETLLEQLRKTQGSVQEIESIPKKLRDKYKTIWELGAENEIQMSIDRSPFVDQSQSMNLYFDGNSEEVFDKIVRALVMAWEGGLKTGCYYIKTQAQVKEYFISAESTEEDKPESSQEEDACNMCSG